MAKHPHQFIEGKHYHIEADGTRVLLRKYRHRRMIEIAQYSSPVIHNRELQMGQLVLLGGFKWDGASGPTKDDGFEGKHPLLDAAFSGRKTSARASAVHDAGYGQARDLLGPYDKRNKRQRRLYKFFQKVWDKEFKRILKSDGMGWFRRNYWYRAVRLFGFKAITGQWKNTGEKMKRLAKLRP